MSTIIMSACWPIQGMSAPQKAVLISLADMANDDGVCWPSIAHIAKRTCLSSRSVQSAIKWLIEAGLLSVTERAGRSTIYTVTPAGGAPLKDVRGAGDDKTPAPRAPAPARGAPAPAPRAPITINNHQGTVKEPINTPAARVKSYSVDDLVALGVNKQVAAEFLAIRKKKRAPLTEIALAGIKRESTAVGWTLDQTLRKCVERGWQGFEASWVKNDKSVGANKHGNFSQQDYYAGVAEDGTF